MIHLLPLALAASETPLEAMQWNWDKDQRFLIESQVQLPYPVMFRARYNKEVRVVGFQVQGVWSCSRVHEGKRRDQVFCTIEQASIVAGTQPGDRGRGLAVFEEFAELLTGTRVELAIHHDGRVQSVLLPDLKGRNLRARRANETLRLIARFQAMGLDLPLDTRGGTPWVTGQSLLCTLPTDSGTTSGIHAVHIGRDRGARVEFASHGKGTMNDPESANIYTCETTARGFFDRGTGPVNYRWEMLAEPTASSPVTFGAAGYAYTQQGQLQRLAADEATELQPTAEILLDERGTAILSGVPLD